MESKKPIIKNKFFLLLTSLLLFFILSPIFNTKMGSFYFGILFTVVLLFSVLVITHTKWFIILTILLAVLVVIGTWLGIIYKPIKVVNLIETAFTAVFFILITTIVLSRVIRDKIIKINTLLGAICGYLLIGLFWSFVFLFIHYTDSTAFNLSEKMRAGLGPELQNFIYYSFVSLTTLGYGDITPVEGFAKTFSWIEAATGQIYLTVWIAHLVGMYVARRTHRISRSS